MIFLLPCEPFNLKKVDYDFKDEYLAIESLGMTIYLFDHDEFVTNGNLVTDFNFTKKTDVVVLRSWMLKSDQYKKLWNILGSNGFSIINSPEEYTNCHHYPNCHKWISEHSPKSVYFTDLSPESIIRNREMIDGDVIIKDYVKSEKGLDDIFILEKKILDEDLVKRVNKFKNTRGQLFNEGIVFKEVLNLKKYGDKTNEFRIFYLNHNRISICQNSDLPWGNKPTIIPDVSKIESNFFTVDIAELDNGNWIILECGDGGVSGIPPTQDILNFYMNFEN